MSFRGGLPNPDLSPHPPTSAFCRMGSSSHLGFTCICPSIPRTHFLPLICRFQIPNPPLLSSPRQSCLIPVTAAPSLPPKSLLTWPSAVSPLSPVATTDPRVSPLPLNPYPLRIRQKWDVNQTLCHCSLPPVNVFLERLCTQYLKHSVCCRLPPRSVFLQ